MESAAHRAGLPILQRLSQQSSLGVQEGAVFVAIDELGLFFLGAGLLVALLGRLQCLPGGVAVLQPLIQVLDGLLLFLGSLLTLAQSLLLFRQTLGFLETLLVGFQCLVLLLNIFRKRRLLAFECLPLRLQRGDLLPLLPAIFGLAGQGLQSGLAVLYLGCFPQKAFPLRFHIGEAGQLLFLAFQQAGLGLLVVLLPGLCLLPDVDLLVKGGQSGFFSGQFLILGPRRLKGSQLPAESVPLGLLVLFLLQGFLRLFHLGQQGVPVLGCSFQILPCFLGGFRLAQQGGSFVQLGFQLIQKLLLAGFLGLILFNQLPEQFLSILEGQFSGLRFLKLEAEGVLRRTDGAGNVLPDAGPGCFTGLLQGG